MLKLQADTFNACFVFIFRVSLVLILYTNAPLHAAEPNTHITQYAHSVWYVRDGWFAGSPTSVAQTKDGYLWVGTESGLLRYDGEHFETFQPTAGQGHLLPLILFLQGASDGSLLVADSGGVSRLEGDRIFSFQQHTGRVNQLLEAKDGAIWYVRTRIHDGAGPLCRILSEEVRCFGKKDGLATEYGVAITQDHTGDLWVGGSNELTRWNSSSSKDFSAELHNNSHVLAGVEALAETRNGKFYVGSVVTSRIGGLQQLVQGHFRDVVFPGFDGRKVGVQSLLVDREGALWVGTIENGLYRIYRNSVEHYRRSDGLSADDVNSIFQDREGTIWVATTGGLDNFRDIRVRTFTINEGLEGGPIAGLSVGREGTVWAGSASGINLIRGNSVSKLVSVPIGGHATSILVDQEGRNWVGIGDGLFLYEAGHFREIRLTDGQPAGPIESITEDTSHVLWAVSLVHSMNGGSPTLIRVEGGNAAEVNPMPPTARLHIVRADIEHGVWLSYDSGQLLHLTDGKLSGCKWEDDKHVSSEIIAVNADEALAFTSTDIRACRHGSMQTMDLRNGLPSFSFYAGRFDLNGTLWVMSSHGLLSFSKSEFDAWWNHPDSRVRYTLFDTTDGVQPTPIDFDSKSVVTPDGQLWFAGEAGLSVVDPQSLTPVTLPPAVTIEGLTADHKLHSVSGLVVLPPLTQDIEIHYAALSYVSPAKIRFRYQLNGLSGDWQDPGSRRTAYFQNLKPGKYHFRVIAANGDAWNQQGADLTFIVAPRWYQTRWAIAGLVLIILTVARISYTLRIRIVARAVNARFEERLAERTRMARQLHDTFLQTVQGSKMVVDDALAEGNDDTRKKALVKLSDWLGQAITEGRSALKAMRSSATESNRLAESLRHATEDMLLPSGMIIDFLVNGQHRDLHPIVRDEVWLIGFEAIRNALRHSRGTQLHVILDYSTNFELRVIDDGVGMPKDVIATGRDGHFGLTGMRERSLRVRGKFTAKSHPGRGTEIAIIIPGSVAYRATGTRSLLARMKQLFLRDWDEH